MNSRCKWPLTAAFGFLLAAAAIDAAHAKDPGPLSLPAEHFRATATVKEASDGGPTIISTENGYSEHTGPFRMVWNDEYLQATIDRKSGERSFAVSAWVIYNGRLRSYDSAEYAQSAGERLVPTLRVGRQVTHCEVGDCTYTEWVSFPVDEALLRQLSAHSVGKPEMWRFRLIPKSGPAYEGGVSTAEIAGLLARADEYTASGPLVTATARAALVRNLGIGGIPVEASPDLPQRAGVLVTGVTRDSVAHRAGLIVGDIVYEFDGRPIKQMQDLDAAVAACSPDSAVKIGIFRGKEPTAVTARF